MAFYHRNNERKRIPRDYKREEEVDGSLCRLGRRSISPKSLYEHEKRIRREIANSNERRRMQSINAGFQALRALLPHRTGEDLSKAAILERTADYVFQLKQDKIRLLEQNNRLSTRMLNSSYSSNNDSDGSCSDSPILKKLKSKLSDSVDERTESSNVSTSEHDSEVMNLIQDLRRTLERERALRLLLEEKIGNLESRLSDLDNDYDTADEIYLQNNNRSPTSVFSLYHRYQNSGQDVDRNEVSLRESNPDPSNAEIPKDLSMKSNARLLSCHEPSVPNSASQQDTCKVGSQSKKNLEIIVEAIKHVEGDIFRGDDPKPVESELLLTIKEEKGPLSEEQIHNTVHSLSSRELSLHHQIVRNALLQSRPEVIIPCLP